jgi:hypothetical protein
MPIDPNVESSGLDPVQFGLVAQVPPRRLFQKGARAIQWQSEDRNNDTLEYSIHYRSINENTFRLLKDKVRETFYTIDSATLADGRYIIRVVASDAPDNPAGQALSGERISEPIEIDNTPPVVRTIGQPLISSNGIRVVFEAEEVTGKVKKADLSVDGNSWSPVFPDDGIADNSRERYTVDLPIVAAGEHTVSLRVYDTTGNVGTLSVVARR